MSRPEHLSGDLLSAFLDKELNAADAESIKAHLQTCEECVQALDALHSAKRVLSAAPERTMPADLAEAMKIRFSRPSLADRLRSLFPRTRWWMPVSFALASVSLGVFVFVRTNTSALPLEPLLAAHSRYTAENVSGQTDIAASNFSLQLASYEMQPD